MIAPEVPLPSYHLLSPQMTADIDTMYVRRILLSLISPLSSLSLCRVRFTIDCLMGRYRNVDWRHSLHKHCNNQYNPQLDLRNDGFNLDPFEVLFVKVSDHKGCIHIYPVGLPLAPCP